MFTDVVKSTIRWEVDPEGMRSALEEHNLVLERIVRDFDGHVFKTIGDAFCVAYPDPEAAAASALEAQRQLPLAPDPLTVRIGLHTGSIRPTGDDYFGPPVNRVARIMSSAQAGQIVISDASKVLLPSRFSVRDLGEHGLKDLLEPSRLWQLGPGEFGPIQSMTSHRNNLPIQTTSFVGRQGELIEVVGLLSKSRLVTLTGTGGTGKSRLAIHFAAENLDKFPHGIWFLELAALPDRESVLRELVRCVGAPDFAGTVTERLIDYLRQKSACLIVDNCEHVLDVVSETVEKIVRACPNLTILATSREPLGATGEIVYRVPSLPTPPPSHTQSIRQLEGYGSSALFIERLFSAVPNYDLADSDAPTIAKICKRLDGIPLALELAAARGRAMTLDQVEKRLDDRFRLLSGGSRSALSRQQTLQALIDWSVQLLNKTEQRLFISLAVFASSWDLDATESICGCHELEIEAWEVLDLLTALVDKSLVLFDSGSGRYKMLESIRQYASVEMMREPWNVAIRDRHADHYISAADPKVSYLMVLSAEVQRFFVTEFENIRMAFDWARAVPERAARGAMVAAALWPGFLVLERSTELAGLLESLLESGEKSLPEADAKRCRVTLAVACARSGDPRALGMLEGLRDELAHLPKSELGYTITALAYGLFRARRFETASEVIEPFCLPESGIEAPFLGYVWCISGLARAARGEFESAIHQFQRSVEEHRACGDWRGCAANQSNFAIIECLRGRLPEALTHSLDMNRVCMERQVHPIARVNVLGVFGLLALASGDIETAAALYGGGVGRFQEGTDPPDPLDAMFIDLVTKKIRSVVGLDHQEAAIAIGRLHDWEPWHRALMSLEPGDILTTNGFKMPFAELLPQIRN